MSARSCLPLRSIAHAHSLLCALNPCIFQVPETHALKKRSSPSEAARYAALHHHHQTTGTTAAAGLPNWLAHARAVPMHPSIAATWAPKRYTNILGCGMTDAISYHHMFAVAILARPFLRLHDCSIEKTWCLYAFFMH